MTLRLKLTLAFLLVASLVLGGLAAFAMAGLRGRLEAQLAADVEHSLDRLGRTLVEPVWTINAPQVSEMLMAELLGDQHLLWAEVRIGAIASVRVGRDADWRPVALAARPVEDASALPHVQRDLAMDQASGPRRVGTVELAVSRRQINAELAVRRYEAVVQIVVLDAVLVAVVYLLLGRLLQRRLRSLVRVLDAAPEMRLRAGRGGDELAHAVEGAGVLLERLTAVLDALADCVITTDADLLVERINPAAAELLGSERAAASGRPLLALLEGRCADSPALVAAIREQVLHAGRAYAPGEAVAFTRVAGVDGQTGAPRRAQITAMPVAGAVAGVVVVLRDVTERLVAEERLHQAEKLESVGKLAGGIAHDFNNMLAVMCAAAGLAERAESDVARRGHLRTIITSAEQVAESNRRLLAFARKDPVRREVHDLREVVGQAHELLRHSLERAIAIRCDCGTLPLPVLGDRSALLNALINLGINARDAMPDGGTLAITTAPVEPGPGERAAGGGELPPGPYAELTVSDSGHGIPDEVLPRIFDPFFTTKPVGKGTGLGLSAVYGTVRAHGGAISASNLPGGGARFRLVLPLTTKPPSRPVPRLPTTPLMAAPAASAAPTEPPVVLLVDDDPEVRQLTADILADLGCTVLTAGNGREALVVLAAEGERIRLAVLDVIMPEMGGVEAFREMRHLRPGLRVLFSSGYAGGDDVVALVEPGRVAAIEKPFTMAQLGTAVKGLLGP